MTTINRPTGGFLNGDPPALSTIPYVSHQQVVVQTVLGKQRPPAVLDQGSFKLEPDRRAALMSKSALAALGRRMDAF